MKKKKHSSIPRHKRLTRPGRLAAAPLWMAKSGGRNLVKSYSRHFAVDMLCAVSELKMLGVAIDPQYEAQLRSSVAGQVEAKERRKAQRAAREINIVDPVSDPYFYFIAGYTQAGFPYGITWEEAADMGLPGPDPGGQ